MKAMTERESLWYLINGLNNKDYDIKTFCSEFTRIFDLELDYDELNTEERKEFYELCEMAGRFSDDKEELLIPNMYCNEKDIREKVTYIIKNIENK